MSESNDKPFPPLSQSEKFNEAFGDIRDRVNETLKDNQEQVDKTLSFYEQNEDVIKAFVFIGCVLLLNKRMVRMAIRRELKNLTLLEMPVI